MNPPPLQVFGLHKHFGGVVATADVSLTLEHTQVHAVIGPNGAGKTTLMKLICGELPCDAGRILLQGRDVTSLSVHRRAALGLGRTFQLTSVFPQMTALANVALAVQSTRGHSFRFWRPVASERVLCDGATALLDQVGLDPPHHHRPAGTLSYGDQRKLELAMALALEPALLLLDEPLAGTGPGEAEAMVSLLSQLRRQVPLLLVEHDMAAVFALADVVTVLVDGRVIARGPPDVVRRDPGVLAAYLGEEQDLWARPGGGGDA
ncbi:MAG: ABC transporter ATP-binding protein [Candidatus Competibacterales bacterium]